MTQLKTPLQLLGILLLVAACGSPTPTRAPSTGATLKLAPVSALPPEIQQLPPDVQEAYRFALANPDVLEKIPCYCGCNRVGHVNNLMCYIQPGGAGQEVTFDFHGAG